MKLDTTDYKLLGYLQEDAKQTNKELANKLNLSVTAVYERIKKLERNGIIDRYVALINRKAVNQSFMVFCEVKLVQHTKENVTHFEKAVKELSEVQECFHVSGGYDYLLKVLVSDMDQFRSFMVNKLTTIQHIGSTQSSFTISEVKNSTAIAF